MKHTLISSVAIARLVALALLAALAGSLLPQSASAATIDTAATYKLVARHSGKALDVSGASTADGGDVVQWSDTGANNQHW